MQQMNKYRHQHQELQQPHKQFKTPDSKEIATTTNNISVPPRATRELKSEMQARTILASCTNISWGSSDTCVHYTVVRPDRWKIAEDNQQAQQSEPGKHGQG